MPQEGTPQYNQIISVATVLVSNVIAVLLAHGFITASIANQLTNSAATIGSVIILLVMNGALVIGNQMHRLKYGPVPNLQPAPSTAQLLQYNSAPSPSYGPPSTGNEPPEPENADLPAEVI